MANDIDNYARHKKTVDITRTEQKVVACVRGDMDVPYVWRAGYGPSSVLLRAHWVHLLHLDLISPAVKTRFFEHYTHLYLTTRNSKQRTPYRKGGSLANTLQPAF